MHSSSPRPRLRSAVLAQVWATLEGVDALTAPSGGPLTRTIKRILDPLVLRTTQHPALGRAMVDEEAARAIAQRIERESARLAATSAWFVACKRARRVLGVVGGNPQDRYFPLAFELATTYGAPGHDADALAEHAVAEAHAGRSTTQDAVAAYLADAARAGSIDAALEERWRAALEAGGDWGTATTVVDVEALLAADDDAAWTRLVASAAALSDAMRADGGAARLHAVLALLGGPVRAGAAWLGLQADDVAARPDVVGPVDAPVLERSVQRRATAAVRRRPHEPVEDIVDDEVTRATEPFGLFTPASHALLVAGIAVAPALSPLTPVARALPLLERLAEPLEREASVLHARRLPASARASTPGIAAAVADLVDFQRPWLRRLWARLHGLDQEVVGTTTWSEASALASGVVRSTILDVRQKVRKDIEAHETGRHA